LTQEIYNLDKKYIEIGLWQKLSNFTQRSISIADRELKEANTKVFNTLQLL
jgi:hypothetical protein